MGLRSPPVSNRRLDRFAGTFAFDCMDAGGRATQEQLPSVWTLSPGDSNFSMRWRLIKSGFSRALPKTERRSKVRRSAGERGVWHRIIESISSVKRPTINAMSTMFMRIPCNMDTSSGWRIGLIRVFTAMLQQAFIHLIGAAARRAVP